MPDQENNDPLEVAGRPRVIVAGTRSSGVPAHVIAALSSITGSKDETIPLLPIRWGHQIIRLTKDEDTPPIDLSYDPELPVFLDVKTATGIHFRVEASEVIKVALDIQAKSRQQDEDVIDVEHQTMLDEILKHANDDDGTIQVLEGGVDNVLPEHFSGNTATSILEMVHFIEVNNLQEKRPWCVVWNMYRCMLVAAGR